MRLRKFLARHLKTRVDQVSQPSLSFELYRVRIAASLSTPAQGSKCQSGLRLKGTGTRCCRSWPGLSPVSPQRGKIDDPIKNSSTARAHCRPSRIAHTTSDCPRRTSPAANTLGTEVA